jgi:hypothetical protein
VVIRPVSVVRVFLRRDAGLLVMTNLRSQRKPPCRSAFRRRCCWLVILDFVSLQEHRRRCSARVAAWIMGFGERNTSWLRIEIPGRTDARAGSAKKQPPTIIDAAPTSIAMPAQRRLANNGG